MNLDSARQSEIEAKHSERRSTAPSGQAKDEDRFDTVAASLNSQNLAGCSITLFSPAKLNLFFRVLYKREDGFHEIASLYQAISLGDTLTVSLAEDDLLTCTDPNVPCDSSNLIFKALDAYRRQTGNVFKVHIHLDKKVPMQAGLGGGSGNAATAMWAFNALSSRPVPEEVLSEWVGAFSSDAPFFFSQGAAYCRGRGEKIENIGKMPDTKLWIAKPQEGLSTPLVYRHCRPSEFPQRDPDQFLTELVSGNPCYFNDLEVPAFSLMPSLARLKDQLLEQGFSHATMTGSGTAFFCLGPKPSSQIPGIDFYPASFVSRSNGNWYEFPSV
ncbi:MAG: 4-(cytidine 5'-diphospho)-2-C-methyl-D-erythritol kinase [Parachlamydiales bacterium]|nr:4-(cytidine 5'-diphospho)-2-C-methyl-D-erythritol kinase [Candidatus Acheromyda pituitae]